MHRHSTGQPAPGSATKLRTVLAEGAPHPDVRSQGPESLAWRPRPHVDASEADTRGSQTLASRMHVCGLRTGQPLRAPPPSPVTQATVVTLRGPGLRGCVPRTQGGGPPAGRGSHSPAEPVTAPSVAGSGYPSPLRVWLPAVTQPWVQQTGAGVWGGLSLSPSEPVRALAPGFLQMPTPAPGDFLEGFDNPDAFRRSLAFQKKQLNSSSRQELIQMLQSTLSFLA